MGTYDHTADILFHAAMCIGTGQKNSPVGAIYEAYRYLGEHVLYSERSLAINLYGQLNGHKGDAWPTTRSRSGGQWIVKAHMHELLMSMLLTYEYVVQDLGAARSPVDPNRESLDNS